MLRLMSYNIRFGGTGREKRIADVIRQAGPDIVILQEATDPDVVERLSELTEMPFSASKKGQSAAFLSRAKPKYHEWHLHRKMQRAVLEVELDGLRIFGVHLRATHSNYTERGRMREVRALLEFLKPLDDEFHLLAGDFNTLAPGELLSMQKLPMRYRLLAMMLGGRVTYRAIQMMLDGGYFDTYRMLHSEPGWTFPAWEPNVRLDYFFVPQQYAERVVSCDVIKDIRDPEKATDHLPIVAEIKHLI
jgi:exodeoxyribonuclease-3